MSSSQPISSADLAALISSTLDADKAEQIVTVDLAGKTSMADFMVIASGMSTRHVSSLADSLQKKLKEDGYPILGLEGQESADWVLLDAGDVVVHLFKPDMREVYNLEKLWSVTITEPEKEAGATLS